MLVMNKNMFISENNNRCCCCWLDLPHEILELIMKRLFYADLLNFRVVCKSWNSSINRSGGGGVPPLKQSPWLLLIEENKFTLPPPGVSITETLLNWLSSSKACSCKLFDPVYKKTYTINNNNNININLFLIQHVYASKHGWILSSVPYNLGQDQTFSCSLVFAYTPFSSVNNFIELPILLSSSKIHWATFTSNPMDQKDCLFLVLRDMSILTCRPGDKSWNTLFLRYSLPEFVSRRGLDERWIYSDERWIYSEGNLYCIIYLFSKQQPGQQIRTVRVVKWEFIMKERPLEKLPSGDFVPATLYGSVMNKELDHEHDDVLSKLEKDHFSIPNKVFVYPDFTTVGIEYESRKMVKIDPPHT